MVAVSVTPRAVRADGKREVMATILSNTTPSPLPTTGKGITGMNENDVFAPFSILFVVADVGKKVYIANESGVFVAQ